MPQTLTRMLSSWLALGGDDPEASGLGGHWVRVQGDPLPAPALVRIDRASDGRLIVTGLVLGYRDRREITWETMRKLKPATILSLIFSGFDPDQPARLMRETDSGGRWVTRGDDPDDDIFFDDVEADVDGMFVWEDTEQYREHARAMAALAIWEATGGPHSEQIVEVNKPRASVATDLQAFASTYLRHYAANPRRATTATAQELHISRATAIRRLNECRELGLIPPKEQA